MEEIANGIFVETAYEGVNVGAIVTNDGVVCIDVPSYPRDAREWAHRVDRLHGRGLRYLILTDFHGDRILNTRWMNAPIIAHQSTSERLVSYDRRYPQQLLESLVLRNPMLGRDLTNAPVDQVAISFDGTISLNNSDRVMTLCSRPGPTPGTIWVSLPESGILFAGDSVVSGVHPPLSEMCLQKWQESLARLYTNDFDVQLIVPGRGDLCGPAEIEPLLGFLERISSVVGQHIAAERSRQALADHVDEFSGYFPSLTTAPEWADQQISLGLQRAYDELIASARTKEEEKTKQAAD